MEGAAWASERDFALRFVTDLLAGGLAAMRRSAKRLPPLPWDETTRLTDLGADSLETLELATALASAIHLHRAGIEDALLARRTLGEWVDVAQAGLAAYHDEVTFATSGSTGRPKSCTQVLAALDEEVEELSDLFHARRRVVSAVPSHHVYGFLFTILLPQRLGLRAGSVVDVRAHSPASVGASLRPGDLLVAYPEWWRGIARSGSAISPGVIGVTSTAPCDDEVSADVERAGIGALFHVYGASETAGVGWRPSYREPYRLFRFWSRAPGDDLALVRTLPGGHVVTARPQDRLHWLDARRFRLEGRLDAAVQVGGINVHPGRVREVLLRHPGVRDAAVRLMRPEEGARLKAYVAVDEGHDATELEGRLVQWLERHLAAPERPRAITFGRALPRHESGKLADWDIAGLRSRAPD